MTCRQRAISALREAHAVPARHRSPDFHIRGMLYGEEELDSQIEVWYAFAVFGAKGTSQVAQLQLAGSFGLESRRSRGEALNHG
jgi:hypothetical protein